MTRIKWLKQAGITTMIADLNEVDRLEINKEFKNYYKDDLKVSLAGPITNFLIAIAIFFYLAIKACPYNFKDIFDKRGSVLLMLGQQVQICHINHITIVTSYFLILFTGFTIEITCYVNSTAIVVFQPFH